MNLKINGLTTEEDKVYIVILNYNGWKDTLVCLESVFHLHYPNFQVVVIDNCSTDHSMDHIKSWAEGNLINDKGFSNNPVQKPLSYIEYTSIEAQNIFQGDKTDNSYPLILINSDKNLGFTGGNNIVLRYALRKNDFKYVLLLNNDTVIDKDAVRHLVDRSNYLTSKNVKVGMVGGKVYYYHLPNTIQYAGGARLNKWLATTTAVGFMEEDKGQYDVDHIQLDYLSGACVLISKDFISQVGLMDEGYFFYFDEIDWALRGKNNGGWELGYAYKSKVFHKEGASAGGNNLKKDSKSKFSDFYAIRNRIRFTKKFYPHCLPIVYASLFLVIFNRIRRKQFDRVLMIFKILLDTNAKFDK